MSQKLMGGYLFSIELVCTSQIEASFRDFQRYQCLVLFVCFKILFQFPLLDSSLVLPLAAHQISGIT